MASRKAMSTLNAKEIKKFEALAAEWWNPNGPAKGQLISKCPYELIVQPK